MLQEIAFNTECAKLKEAFSLARCIFGAPSECEGGSSKRPIWMVLIGLQLGMSL